MAGGFALVGLGCAGLAVALPAWGVAWLVFVCWFVAGTGMGIGISSTAVSVLARSPEADRGFNSAALQISDMLGQAVLVGAGGVVVASLATPANPAAGVLAVDLVLLVAAQIAAALVLRAGRAQPR